MKFNVIKRKIHTAFYWRTPLGELLTKVYDLVLHFRYSFKNKNLKDKSHLSYFLYKQYHIIEKGLALPEPRLGFGVDKISLLISNSEIYIKKYGPDSLTASVGYCLKSYLDFNDNNDHQLDASFRFLIESFLSNIDYMAAGGTKNKSKEEIVQFSNINFSDFARHRHSIRIFSDDEVDDEDIYKAVDIAKYTPSVCNRQGWHVHTYSDASQIKKLLSMQNGNTGFTDNIMKLIIITGNIKAFTKYESNQVFTDGGLFAMNLIYSIHNLGLGTCPLNTCLPYTTETKIKKIGDIPNNERLIMMLAVGHLKDEFKVAISQRKPTNEFLTSNYPICR